MKREKYDLEDRLIAFAVLIIDLVSKLPNDKVTSHLGNQLLRSGTAPAFIYGEALSAESRRDFVHKLKLLLKELRETMINLKILHKIKYASIAIPGKECDDLIAIFVKSVTIANSNLER